MTLAFQRLIEHDNGKAGLKNVAIEYSYKIRTIDYVL